MPEITASLPTRPRVQSSTTSPARSASSISNEDVPHMVADVIPEDAVPDDKPKPNTNATLQAPETTKSSVQQASPQRPGGLTKRLTRMFSQNGRSTDKSPERPKDGVASETGSAAAPSEPSSKPPSKPPSRTPSYRGSEQGRKHSIMGRSKDNKDTPEPMKRFELTSDGGHEHHLKSARRQEKLSGMLRDMLGGKKKDDHEGEVQHLSLMSTWVDQLKNERDKLAADKKGGPNSTATLVEKYGKCQEIVGRGAFGIVRISHKPDPNDSKNEQLYAVKEFRKRPQESAKKYQKRLTAEFCISSSLRHPNVIHTLDLLQDAKGE